LAVIFRQRWEGFQILAGNPQAGSQPARGARKARGKPFQPTTAPRSWADGRPIISPGMSGIHQSNRQLRPYPWPRSPLAAVPIGRSPSLAIRRACIQGPRGRRCWPEDVQTSISKASPVWRFGNSREAGDYGTNNRLLA